MIAGGLDTTPACLLLGVAILSGKQGESFQEKMLAEINSIYPDGDAWEKCLDEEKCLYVQAFCKEVLRFWTVIPMSLPRVSIRDVTWEGALIPAGTTFLMVSDFCSDSGWTSHQLTNFHKLERMGGKL
jgi:phenylacetate 2-hydroxylase